MTTEYSNISISTIRNFDEYLTVLKRIKEKYLIIFAVKDTPGHNFRPESASLLKELGLETDMHDKHGHSFFSIISRGKNLLERLSVLDETIADVLDIDGIRVAVKSSVYNKENVAKIELNYVDYAIDLRGLNIVVFDTETHALIDSVCFDTHVESNVCYRKEDKLGITMSFMEDQMRYMKNSLEQLKKQNEDLKQLLKTNQHKQEMLLWQLYRAPGESEYDGRKRFFMSLQKADSVLRKMQLAGLILLKRFDRICREHNIKYWLNFGSLLGAVRHRGFIPWDDDTDVGMMREDILKLQKVMEGNKDFCLDEFYTVRRAKPIHMHHNYQFHYMKPNTPYSLDIFVYDYSEDLSQKRISDIMELKEEMYDELTVYLKNTDKDKRPVTKEYSGHFQEMFNNYYERQVPLLGDNSKKKYMVWAIDNLNSSQGLNSFLPCDYVFPLTEMIFEGHQFYAPNKPELYVNSLYGDIYNIPEDIYTHIHFNLSDEQKRILDEILDDYIKFI